MKFCADEPARQVRGLPFPFSIHPCLLAFSGIWVYRWKKQTSTLTASSFASRPCSRHRRYVREYRLSRAGTEPVGPELAHPGSEAASNG